MDTSAACDTCHFYFGSRISNVQRTVSEHTRKLLILGDWKMVRGVH